MNKKRNIIMNIAYIIIGIVLIACAKTGMISDTYLGFGGGILGVGIVLLAKNIRYVKNKEYQENVDIESGDERNRYIRMKAWSWAGYLYVLIMAVATIICMIIEKTELMQYCSLTVCIILVLYWGSYLIINRNN